jgi:hypothetical protein
MDGPVFLCADPMSEKFFKILEESLRREYGGPVPRSVALIAERVGSETRQALIRAGLRPDRLTEIEMTVVDLTISAIREAIFRERNRSGSPDWYNGFGSLSRWNLNAKANGKP